MVGSVFLNERVDEDEDEDEDEGTWSQSCSLEVTAAAAAAAAAKSILFSTWSCGTGGGLLVGMRSERFIFGCNWSFL